MDQIAEIENLEGTQGQDRLVGNGVGNQLLGRSGKDIFDARGGADLVLANADDDDISIDCGDGENDVLKRDAQEEGDIYRDRDQPDTHCEERTDEPVDYATTQPDEDLMACNAYPLAYWPFDDRSGPTAFAEVSTADGTYNGSVVLRPARDGAIADSDGTAVGLDGKDDYINLGTGFDPSGYTSQGYSVETWVKFEEASDNGFEIIYSRLDSAGKGMYLARWWNVLVFVTVNSQGTFVAVDTNPAHNSVGVWHHLVSTISPPSAGRKVNLYVDGGLSDAHSYDTVTTSVFPPALGTTPNLVGTGTGETRRLQAVVDDFAIYSRALNIGEVAQHFYLRSEGSGYSIPRCD